MSYSTDRLSEIQKWMHAMITHPGGIDAAVAAREQQQGVGIVPHNLESVILPSKRLTSQQRLAIYHEAYYARLLECLRSFFPTLTHTIGQETFDDFAFGYLQKYPSRSYTLNRLSDCFVQFLEETKPQDETSAEIGWPDFLIDLARLEWAIDDVFDGPGNEREKPLSILDLQTIPSERWPAVQMKVNPSLRLLEFRFPVNDFYSQFRRGEAPDFPAAKRTWIAVHRREFVVRRNELTYEQYLLLQGISAGRTLGDAILATVEEENVKVDELQARLASWFESWTADQFFAAISANTES